MSINEHISEVLSSCHQSLYALRLLKAYGLNSCSLCLIFKATVLAKITYASPAWRGLMNANDHVRLEAFLKKAKKAQYCNDEPHSIAELFDIADHRLFASITSDKNHVYTA